MKIHVVGFIFFAGILFLIMGCGDSPPLTNLNPGLGGDLAGYAYFIGPNGLESANDSGITVSVEGDSQATVTQSTGLWFISGLSNGYYNLDFSKPGYGLIKILGQKFVSGSLGYTVASVTLYPIPTFSVARLSDSNSLDSATGQGSVDFYGTFSRGLPNISNNGLAYIFFDTSAAVSSNPKNYLAYTFATNIVNPNDTITNFYVNVDTATFQNEQFKSGQTIYAVAYGGNNSATHENGIGYVDSTTGRYVFTGLDSIPSSIDSFSLP